MITPAGCLHLQLPAALPRLTDGAALPPSALASVVGACTRKTVSRQLTCSSYGDHTGMSDCQPLQSRQLQWLHSLSFAVAALGRREGFPEADRLMRQRVNVPPHVLPDSRQPRVVLLVRCVQPPGVRLLQGCRQANLRIASTCAQRCAAVLSFRLVMCSHQVRLLHSSIDIRSAKLGL